MQAEIISIGDELLIGQTINTNAAWMGEELNKIGIRVHRSTSIADDRDEIVRALREAGDRSDLVLITGGLGPTKDDITKKTLCELFGSKLVINEEALQRITGFFAGRGLPMLDVNRDQALLPDNCTVIQNLRGTACGMWFEKQGKVYVSMPGVPYEMTAMMEEDVIPKINAFFDRPEIHHHTILTLGIGESFLAQKIEDWENSLATEGIKLAYLPSPGSVKLRMSSYGQLTGDRATAVFAQKSKELEALIGEYIFGTGKETIQEVIGKLLLERNQTVSTAESCTGGNIAHLITAVPGSSGYFPGGLISYSNHIKINELGVNPKSIETHSIVSQQVAEEMAEGIRKKMNADWGIATTGIAGPDGGTDHTPVGTVWMAISGHKSLISNRYNLGNNRGRIISIASHYALNLLRKEILGQNG
ncbi:MAG: competence/damage-inducible protein A [Flavobacteriales bacterium]